MRLIYGHYFFENTFNTIQIGARNSGCCENDLYGTAGEIPARRPALLFQAGAESPPGAILALRLSRSSCQLGASSVTTFS